MNLYIDCEWNDYGGDLISMALVAENGLEFYEVLGCNDPAEWVKKNVMPILQKNEIRKGQFDLKLSNYLMQFKSINIISDWPEDISRFCDALIIGPGTRIDTPPLTMQIVRIDAVSDLPHNALEDARGIKRALSNEQGALHHDQEP